MYVCILLILFTLFFGLPKFLLKTLSTVNTKTFSAS